MAERPPGPVDSAPRLREAAGMNVELIRARLKEGFHPFALVVSSGNKYPVPHPEFVLLTQRTVVVADDRGLTVNVAPPHVVALEDLPAPPAAKPKRSSRR